MVTPTLDAAPLLLLRELQARRLAVEIRSTVLNGAVFVLAFDGYQDAQGRPVLTVSEARKVCAAPAWRDEDLRTVMRTAHIMKGEIQAVLPLGG